MTYKLKPKTRQTDMKKQEKIRNEHTELSNGLVEIY